MTTHPSALAWSIPWTEELGRLQSMAAHRVRHDCSNLAHRNVRTPKVEFFRMGLLGGIEYCVRYMKARTRSWLEISPTPTNLRKVLLCSVEKFESV